MSIEAMKQALELLRHCVAGSQKLFDKREATITALRAAIEQAEKPQRVCSGCDKTNTDDSMWAVYCVDCWKQREWVGLTDDEVYDLADEHLYSGGKNYGIISFYKAIEAKLKEKNT